MFLWVDDVGRGYIRGVMVDFRILKRILMHPLASLPSVSACPPSVFRASVQAMQG